MIYLDKKSEEYNIDSPIKNGTTLLPSLFGKKNL
jgi:hypothetical protein